VQSRTSLSFKIKPLVVSVATVMSAFAAAEDTKTKQQTRYMEEITIVGTQTDELAGSAFSVDKERLEVFNFSDINQILVTDYALILVSAAPAPSAVVRLR